MLIKTLKRIGFFFFIIIVAGIFFHMVRLPQDVVAKPNPPPPLTFSGGSGDTPADAVIIQNASDYVAVVAGEYQYLRKNFGNEDRAGWRVALKEVYQHNNKVYDRLHVEFPHDIKRYVYFDITPYFKKP
jgi:hypothetical protein